MSSPATIPADPPDVLAFEVMVTLEDQLALHMRLLSAPAMRAGQLQRVALVALLAATCAPLALAGGLLVGWASDRRGPSFGSLFRTLVLDEPGTLGVAVLVMVGCTVGGMVAQRWLLRPRLRRVLRRILRARPDVDPSDPQLAFRAQVAVSGDGLESRTDIGTTLVRWEVLKRWEQTGGRVMVLGDAMVGFCVYAPAADPGAMDRFRAILKQRLGPKDG